MDISRKGQRMNNLTQQLRERRHALGWSQAKVARLADLMTTHYEKIEAGKLTPRPETLERLDAVLGMVVPVANRITEVGE